MTSGRRHERTSRQALDGTRYPHRQGHSPRLTRYGWAAAAGSADGAYTLPKETSATDTVAITVMTKHSLYALGVSLAIALGIPAMEYPRPAVGEAIRLPVPARTTVYRSR